LPDRAGCRGARPRRAGTQHRQARPDLVTGARTALRSRSNTAQLTSPLRHSHRTEGAHIALQREVTTTLPMREPACRCESHVADARADWLNVMRLRPWRTPGTLRRRRWPDDACDEAVAGDPPGAGRVRPRAGRHTRW